MKKVYLLTGSSLVIASVLIITLTSGDFKSRGGGGRDMVEEFYYQAVKQRDDLRSIEDGIDRFTSKKEEAESKYYSYTQYNNRYYADAKAKAGTIADASVRQRANESIQKSETAYLSKLTEWKTRLEETNAKEKELRGLHALLQILVSQPAIEKYQQTSMPDVNKLKEASGEMQQVIQKIKSITN